MSLSDFIKSKFFVRQLILGAVGFGIFFLIVFRSLGWITNHNEKIVVPDLSKKTLSQAEQILDDMDLRFIVQDSVEYDPEFPRNSVINQIPKPGDIVKSNRKIYISLNASGYRAVTIPEFQGKTKRSVESTLRAVGFEISSEYVYVPDIGKDVVRGLLYKGNKLSAGDKLQKKSVLTLILGRGTSDDEVIDSLNNNSEIENPDF
jgi:hypothetical protein